MLDTTNSFETRCKEYVGGWLMLLYIILIFKGTLDILNGLSYLYMNYNDIHKSIIMFGSVLSIISLLFGPYSIYCGLALWKKWNNAVRNTKIYLIIFLSIHCIGAFYIFFSDIGSISFEIVILGIIPYLIFFLIWYLYLTHSKRVKFTYEVV